MMADRKRECEVWLTHPSPVKAQQAWTCQEWVVIESSVRHWEISAAVIEPFTSCLLAKTRMAAFCRSYVQTREEGLPTLLSVSIYIFRANTFPLETPKISPRQLWQRRTTTSAENLSTCQHADSHSLHWKFLIMLCHGFVTNGAITGVSQTSKHELQTWADSLNNKKVLHQGCIQTKHTPDQFIKLIPAVMFGP